MNTKNGRKIDLNEEVKRSIFTSYKEMIVQILHRAEEMEEFENFKNLTQLFFLTVSNMKEELKDEY